MLGELLKLNLGHGHERIDLVLGALEVLDTECINGYHLDASLVAHLKYLRRSSVRAEMEDEGVSYSSQRFEPQVVPFYSLNVVIAGKTPVTVHNKCNMLRDWTLFKGANEQLS
jgi:hypothetical protein